MRLWHPFLLRIGDGEVRPATTALRLERHSSATPGLSSFLGPTLGFRPQRRWRWERGHVAGRPAPHAVGHDAGHAATHGSTHGSTHDATHAAGPRGRVHASRIPTGFWPLAQGWSEERGQPWECPSMRIQPQRGCGHDAMESPGWRDGQDRRGHNRVAVGFGGTRNPG
jgi:hypothetical protein